MRKLLLLLALSPAALFAGEPNFTRATYSEVVKDVNTVYGKSGKVEKAQSGVGFSSQDLVQSGRGSRAQLTAPDGTIIRVGPNAVFSLDKTTRSIKLECGTILFYSPPGNGGGKIVTDSVTCAVTGTTITVTKDPETGEVLLQVLEGTATLTNTKGQTVTLEAGEKISLPLNYTGPLVTQTFTTQDASSAILVNGFSSPLPSAPKIVAALGGLPAASPETLNLGADVLFLKPGQTKQLGVAENQSIANYVSRATTRLNQSGSTFRDIDTVDNPSYITDGPQIRSAPQLTNGALNPVTGNPVSQDPISRDGSGQLN